MDKIILSRLRVYAHHGALPEEKTLGQPFFISATAELDIGRAAQNDDESLSLCYATLAQCLHDHAQAKTFRTVEALTESLACEALKAFPNLQAITIRVEKPHAPIAYTYDTVAIEVRRENKRRPTFEH
jgi:dihydroneopterin aldolase